MSVTNFQKLGFSQIDFRTANFKLIDGFVVETGSGRKFIVRAFDDEDDLSGTTFSTLSVRPLDGRAGWSLSWHANGSWVSDCGIEDWSCAACGILMCDELEEWVDELDNLLDSIAFAAGYDPDDFRVRV
jgi:hypothetical protein